MPLRLRPQNGASREGMHDELVQTGRRGATTRKITALYPRGFALI